MTKEELILGLVYCISIDVPETDKQKRLVSAHPGDWVCMLLSIHQHLVDESATIDLATNLFGGLENAEEIIRSSMENFFAEFCEVTDSGMNDGIVFASLKKEHIKQAKESFEKNVSAITMYFNILKKFNMIRLYTWTEDRQWVVGSW